MYNDGGVTDNLWGYYDSQAQEYVYPDAHQNFVIKFDDFYLSADDGDFTTDGVTITSEVCQTEDITIGNAPAQVLTATMLNPDGLMGSLTWGYGAAYIGVVTETQNVDLTYSPALVYALSDNLRVFRMTETKAYAGAWDETNISGTPLSIVVNNDRTAWFYTDTNAYYFNGTAFAAATPDDFAANKARKHNGLGVLMDANGLPSTTWIISESDSNTAIKNVMTYIPMGIFNFENVDAYGITFSCEAYDKMTEFDADATEWFNSIDFASPPTKTINWIISEILMHQFGNPTYYTAVDLVNGSMSWDKNPIPMYSVTYRQIIKWLCELQGGNFRIRRDGIPNVYSFNPYGSFLTITPDTVAVNTRTTARYSTAPISEVKCYDLFGQPYTTGTTGSTYYIVGNPFIDPANDITPLSNLCTLLSTDIIGHYPTSLVATCFDPRIDVGDPITIQSADRSTSYKIYIMHMTLKWNGTCTAAISATGNQVRAVPSSLTASDLASQVNSNPAARTVDWEVETPSSVVPGQNDKESLSISTGQIITSETTWDDLGSGSFTYEKTSLMEHGELELVVDTTNDPDGGKRSTTNIFGGHMSLDNEAGGYPDPGGTYQQVMIDPEYPHAIQVSSGTMDSGGTLVDNSVWIGADDIQLTKGNYTKTITADGPTAETGSGTTSIASGSYKTLGSIDFPRGTYLIMVNARFPNNATGRREMLLSASQDSGSAPTEFYLDYRNAVNGNYTNCKFTTVRSFSAASTTMYINAYQNSGSAQAVFYRWFYMRLV